MKIQSIQQNYGNPNYNAITRSGQHSPTVVSFGLTLGQATKQVLKSDLGPKGKEFLISLIKSEAELNKTGHIPKNVAKRREKVNEFVAKIAYYISQHRSPILDLKSLGLPEEELARIEASRAIELQNQDWYTAVKKVEYIDFHAGSSLMRPRKNEVSRHFFLEKKYTKQLLDMAIAKTKADESLIEAAL